MGETLLNLAVNFQSKKEVILLIENGANVNQQGELNFTPIQNACLHGNLDIIEDGYGINLLPLATFALRMYEDDPCECFRLKAAERPDSYEMQMNLRIHKAISVIQFKVEGQIIQRQPAFHLEERALLHRIDYDKGTILLDGKEYRLLDHYFPTIDPENPYELTAEEEEIMERLWGNDEFVDDNTLTVNMTRIRKKMEAAGAVNFIATKRGLGYIVGEESV